MKRRHKWSGPGFTLIELLVVVAVIAILASLLLPALSRAKLSGDTAVCRNNLRQQAMGLAIYVNDFAAYPRYCTGNLITPGKFWMQVLEPYIGGKWPDDKTNNTGALGNGVFACPGYNRLGGVYYHPGDPKGMFGGSGAYAYNAVDGIGINPYGFGGVPIDPPKGYEVRPIKESEVANPSRMISIGDSTILSIPPDGPGSLRGGACAPWFWHLADAMFSAVIAEPYKSLTPGDNAMLKRHGGKWNQVFCDGHVENGRLEKFYDYRNDEVLKLWNRDNVARPVR
jgi:prepilin-type N-terminal cleavage/methylation domain-containing protein/prepilin-type processing-associated H-X9-DG protein